MEKLTIEQKAKAYDEAIERAKKINNEQRAQPFNIMTKVFPELAESEDEKIRKEIMDIIDSFEVAHLRAAGLPTRIPEYLAWLEKQGEQKSVKWGEEDEKLINSVIELIDDGALDRDEKDYFIEKLKSLKERVWPKWEWSKEDERRINHIIAFMSDEERIKDTERMFPIEEDIRWLKSLRPQSQWKPSEEQLRELHCVISGCSFETPILVELEEQLKKL